VKQFSAERELSQLAAGGMTRDGWDDFDAAVSGDVLRIGTIRAPVEPFSLGNGLRRDAENGYRDGRAPQQCPSRAAKGSLEWTNGGSARALACGCQRPRWKHRAGGKEFDGGVEPDSRGRLCSSWVEPFHLGNGFWRDAGNGNRDGRAPQQSPSHAANGSLRWTNGAIGV